MVGEMVCGNSTGEGCHGSGVMVPDASSAFAVAEDHFSEVPAATLKGCMGDRSPKAGAAIVCASALWACGTEAVTEGSQKLRAGMAERRDTVGTDGTTGEPTHSFRATLETLGREALGFGPVKEEDGARAIGDPMT